MLENKGDASSRPKAEVQLGGGSRSKRPLLHYLHFRIFD